MISPVLKRLDTPMTDDTEVVSGTTKLEEIILNVEGVTIRVDGTSWLLEVSDTDKSKLVDDAVDDVPGLAEYLDDKVIEGAMVAVVRIVIL